MKTKHLPVWSLASITLTVILASIVHFYEFGYRALVAGFAVIVVIWALLLLFRQTKNKVFLIFYGLLGLWNIIGFGLFNGFWNHVFKVFLTYLHNGYLPPMLSRLFLNPKIGSFIFETAGILTFTASLFAAYYGYKFIRDVVKEEKNELN